jgi:hypothetical protein
MELLNPVDLVVGAVWALACWLVRRWRIRRRVLAEREAWWRATYGR